MLTNFPLEIVLNVARRLDFHDKLTLTATCHKLSALIAENCLYETLNIKEHDITETVINRFKDKEFQGSQVRHLKLCFDVLSDDLYRQLPDIFPRVIRLVNHSDTEGPRDHFTVRELLKWKDTLQHYDVQDCLFKVGRLIQKNTFSQLKYLRLSTYFALDLSIYKTDLQLLECISHAPLLETLDLYLCEVDETFLESVHNSCSYLKTLYLEKVLLVFREESLPQTIEPASNLICFKLSVDSSICDSNGLFPDYILRKYPNLQTLELLSNMESYYLEDILGEFYSYRREDPIGDHPVSLSYIQSHNGTWDIYKEEDMEFLERLPKSITTLKLYENMFWHIISCIKTAGLQLSTLEISDNELINPGINAFEKDDMLFIKSQTSLKTLKFATDPAMRYHSPEIISTSVTKLYLVIPFASPCNPICIAWVLSVFPAIEKLDIHSEDALYCEADIATYKPNYNLTELNVNHTLTSPTILNVIATLAPNIRHLAYILNEIPESTIMVDSKRHLYNYPITTNEEYGTASYHVDITKFDLDTFKLTCDLGKTTEAKSIDIYFEIVHGKQVKRFIVSSGQKYITVVNDKNSPRLKKKTKVKVSCGKINKLIIDKTISVIFKDKDILLNL